MCDVAGIYHAQASVIAWTWCVCGGSLCLGKQSKCISKQLAIVQAHCPVFNGEYMSLGIWIRPVVRTK